MEYIRYQRCHAMPAHVFEGAYALRCAARHVSLHEVAPGYADPLTQWSPYTGASTTFYVLSAPYLTAMLLASAVPLKARFDGPSLGRVDQNGGYRAADMGTFSRCVTSVELGVGLSASGVRLEITAQAGPVLPETATGSELEPGDRAVAQYRFTIDMPHAAVPAILNFDQQARDGYEAVLRDVRGAGDTAVDA